MKQFVNASDKDGACFKAFSGFCCEKLKPRIFYGPQIRKLINPAAVP